MKWSAANIPRFDGPARDTIFSSQQDEHHIGIRFESEILRGEIHGFAILFFYRPIFPLLFHLNWITILCRFTRVNIGLREAPAVELGLRENFPCKSAGFFVHWVIG